MALVQQRTRIKICGVRDAQTAMAAVSAGADAIGLVFVTASPRSVTVQRAKQIVDVLPAFVEPVGLFVDAPVRQIREIAAELGLSTVQLHGREQPSQMSELAPLRVVKGIAFESPSTVIGLELWEPVYDRLAGILFDAPMPGTEQPRPSGGAGRAFDWAALAKLRQTGRFADLPSIVLAGGLTPVNVGRAISLVHPHAVDVSSGVESSRGVKDVALINAFCRAVRNADADTDTLG